jgi:rubredoxin
MYANPLMCELLGKSYREQHPEVDNQFRKAEYARVVANILCRGCRSKLEPTGNTVGVTWKCPKCGLGQISATSEDPWLSQECGVKVLNGYGLWHNGWASFRTALNPDHIGYGYVGTKEEAEAGRDQFVIEGEAASSYEVILFDPDKEPIGVIKTPSTSQVDALNYVERFETVNRFPAPKNWRQTIRAIYQCGWVFDKFSGDGLQDLHHRPVKLTAAGRRVLGR